MSAPQVICCRPSEDAHPAIETCAAATGRTPGRFVAWAAGGVALAMADALEAATPEQRRGRVAEIVVAVRWEQAEETEP
jgi:hypothetical protein